MVGDSEYTVTVVQPRSATIEGALKDCVGLISEGQIEAKENKQEYCNFFHIILQKRKGLIQTEFQYFDENMGNIKIVLEFERCITEWIFVSSFHNNLSENADQGKYCLFGESGLQDVSPRFKK
ncbi:hypothetical protein NQ317_004740 [Molorchus minor]|uniref:Uncharacterized protein n=1 Tax=Molorchus minor TaxID=1323400 RepID=A0ABQ9JP30_9CUCU|nr:hypothetical protein NQ317_004740 [Molorchus minor]